jgi:hypothetical protein
MSLAIRASTLRRSTSTCVRRAGHLFADFVQVATQGRLSRGVVLRFEARLAQVVENARVGRQLVGSSKLDDRGAEVAIAKEIDPVLKTNLGVVLFDPRRGVGMCHRCDQQQNQSQTALQPCP